MTLTDLNRRLAGHVLHGREHYLVRGQDLFGTVFGVPCDSTGAPTSTTLVALDPNLFPALARLLRRPS